MGEPSQLRRREIIDALRMGAVPRRGLDLFGVGLERFDKALDEELDTVATGKGRFKAVQGDYGTGKTFFARSLEQRALDKGFATTLVQISEVDTPLHKMETVYRRAVEGLRTKEWGDAAFRSLVERWFYALEQEATAPGTGIDPADAGAVTKAVSALLELRLRPVSAMQPAFAAALRTCHAAMVAEDIPTAEGLMAWLMGQPNVGQEIRRKAQIRGELDNDGAAGFLRGLLELLRQTGRKGLVLVLDEVETIQRVREDIRQKGLNSIRQLIDDLAAERFPGLYVLITGTSAFFNGAQGVRRAPALEQRLHVDFQGDPKFDATKAVRVRLQPFDLDRLVLVGQKVRDIYPSTARERIESKLDDATLRAIANTVAGKLGGHFGLAPRLYLRKLVDLLDKLDEHPDFDPKVHAQLNFDAAEMTLEERAAAGVPEPTGAAALDAIDVPTEPAGGGLEG